MNAAVFLDRDGTLIEEKDYLRHADEVRVYPGVVPGLARLAKAGFKLFLVTNQSGVGRGYFTLAQVEAVHRHLLAVLGEVVITKVYVAPEAPDQPSRGRKPSPSFLLDARDEFAVNLEHSYMVGDKLIDMQTGWNAGLIRCLLVRTGYGARTEHEHQAELGRAVVVDTLAEAVDWILANRPAVEDQISTVGLKK